jgi:hypothetical protein
VGKQIFPVHFLPPEIADKPRASDSGLGAQFVSDNKKFKKIILKGVKNETF